MRDRTPFEELLEFFQQPQAGTPGDPLYDENFCRQLVNAASAEEAGIWKMEGSGELRLVYATSVALGDLPEATLHKGEGVVGAVALLQKAIAVSDAWAHPQYNRRMEEQVGFRTRSTVSAPILLGGVLYGVVSIFNYTSGSTGFPPEWRGRLGAVGVMYGAALALADRFRWDAPQRGEPAGPDQRHGKPPEEQTVVVGISKPIRHVLQLCSRAGRTQVPALVRGETGVGKELAARRIHEASDRADGPFQEVNCAALAETLLESELFGHKKGAFTGATQDRQGKFAAASGGTLFLDEIGEMSLTSQAKILRTLQEKKVIPVGSEKAEHCDARIVAATNRNLWTDVEEGRFREDLYYRLCGIEIIIPPLRERPEDIPLLVAYFIDQTTAEKRREMASFRPPVLSDEALEMLLHFSWPGNIRQLRQALLAAMAMGDGKVLVPDDFPPWLHSAMEAARNAPPENNPVTPTPKPTRPLPDMGPSRPQPPTAATRPSPAPLPTAPEKPADSSGVEHEKAQYLQALEATRYPGTERWNIAAAARVLDIPRKTLYYRLRRVGLKQPPETGSDVS